MHGSDAGLQPRLPFEPEYPPMVLVRHPRARRYVISVRDDGGVRVTIPRWGSAREARAFADEQRDWIARQRIRLDDDRRRIEQERKRFETERRRFETERERFETERERFDEDHQSADEDRRRSDEDGLRLGVHEDDRQARGRARVELPARLLELAAQHGLAVARISIRNQRWRWGSCSRDGHICLNWRLVRMPAWVRDYVLVHELMHLRRMDHSPTFWKLVAVACPAYAEARRWLRLNQPFL